MITYPKANPTLTLVPSKGRARIEAPDNKLHYLNAMAAVVWLLCDGTRDLRALTAAVAQEFEKASVPEADVAKALDLLEERGLIHGA